MKGIRHGASSTGEETRVLLNVDSTTKVRQGLQEAWLLFAVCKQGSISAVVMCRVAMTGQINEQSEAVVKAVLY